MSINNRNNTNGNNTSKTIGIIIMVIGLAIALYTGFNNVSNESVVDVRGVQLTTDREDNINWGPYAGIGLIVLGGVVYFAGRKKLVTNDRNSVTQDHNSDNKNLRV